MHIIAAYRARMVWDAVGKAKMKLKLNAVRGPIKNKQGREFWFATAETNPRADEESIWKTIRWSCVFSDQEPPKDWRAGSEVDVAVRSIDYDKGAGVFDVKKA